jgi:hypothetical protein
LLGHGILRAVQVKRNKTPYGRQQTIDKRNIIEPFLSIFYNQALTMHDNTSVWFK